MTRAWVFGVLLASLVGAAHAAAIDCSKCETWNKEQAPFQIFGNTYYVGPRGLASVLVTSPSGHVLIDGALPQSASQIARHIQQLGFKLSDVKIILNSHAHFDHAGGIAELQKLTGAKVIASELSAVVLRTGQAGRSDPQFGQLQPFPGTERVEALGARESVEVGSLKLSVIHTPGHTPGGTSWRWQSCEGQRCLNVVYADSLSAVSDDAFRFSGDARWPSAAKEMYASIAAVAAAPCDLLISAHPERSRLWSAIDAQGNGNRAGIVNASSCKSYAASAKDAFEKRLSEEKK